MATKIDDDEAQDQPSSPGSDLAAVACGLLATAIACVPLALFLLAADDGPRGAWTFADAKQWLGLGRYCLASLLLVVPVLSLIRLAGTQARHWPARLPTVLALTLALPMIPGAVIQLAWWIAG